MNFEISEILIDFKWAINTLIVILLFWLAKKLLYFSPVIIFRTLILEFRQLLQARMTIGAVNALAIIAVLAVSLVIMAVEGARLLSNFIADNIGAAQALSFRKSVDMGHLAIFVTLVSIGSVWIISRHK